MMPSGMRARPPSPATPMRARSCPFVAIQSPTTCAHWLRQSRTSAIQSCARFHQPARFITSAQGSPSRGKMTNVSVALPPIWLR
jgi:hypothetical protein